MFLFNHFLFRILLIGGRNIHFILWSFAVTVAAYAVWWIIVLISLNKSEATKVATPEKRTNSSYTHTPYIKPMKAAKQKKNRS